VKRVVFGVLAALSGAAFTLGVQAQSEDLSFKFQNLSDSTVAQVFYLAADGAPETLAVGVRPGEMVTLAVTEPRDDCSYDLVIAFADGREDARAGVNLCALPNGVLSLH
jgi:hypothetical protein